MQQVFYSEGKKRTFYGIIQTSSTFHKETFYVSIILNFFFVLSLMVFVINSSISSLNLCNIYRIFIKCFFFKKNILSQKDKNIKKKKHKRVLFT